MKKFLITALALLSFSTCMVAQNNKDFDQEYYTMLKKSGSLEVIDRMPTMMLDQMKQAMPNAPEGMIKEIADTISTTINTMIFTKLLPIYKKEITIKEIKEINEFYDTPTGKKLSGLAVKMAEISPELNKEFAPMQQKIMAITQKWMNK